MAVTTTTRQRRPSLAGARLPALVLAPRRPAERPTGQGGKNEVYARLSQAIRRHDKARARRIYFDEVLPDRRFSRGEISRLSYRLGVIDEGDQYLASRADL
jgi:hypothetical protein